MLDHTAPSCIDAFCNDRDIKLVTAGTTEEKIRDLLKQKKAKLADHNVIFEARAYSEIPAMHGFLIGDEVLIAAFCMHSDGSLQSSPYFIFLKDSGQFEL